MSYIPGLETDPLQRLINHTLPHLGGAHHSIAVVALRALNDDGAAVGVGSGLVVMLKNGPDGFWLVTARHVVKEALARGATINVEAIRSSAKPTGTFPVTSVPIANDAWVLAADDDLAAVVLPAGTLPDDHLVGGVQLERLCLSGPNPTPEVQLIGRWGLTRDSNIVLTRRGIVATPQTPIVPIFIGGDSPTLALPMYVVDAFVTSGMSGGAVFESGSRPNVVGIISGHAKVPAPVEKWSSLPESVERAAGFLWEALTPMNAGLVYVVPVERVRKFLASMSPGGLDPSA